MSPQVTIANKIMFLLLPVLIGVALGAVFYRRKFLGTVWGPILGLGALIASALLGWDYYNDMYVRFRTNPIASHIDELHRALMVVCHGAIVLWVVPFAVRFFNKWTGKNLTDAEKTPSGQGIRTWLGAGNVTLAVLISLCAWQGYDYSFWAILALTIGLVIAYPLINMIAKGTLPEAPTPSVDLSAERQRVLKLLEEGKITAEESAELLSALGQTVPPVRVSAAVTGEQKLMLIGLLVVLVSFFLPWLSINPGEELGRAMGQMQNMMPSVQTLPGSQVPMNPPHNMPSVPPFVMPSGENFSQNFNLSTSSIRISGGDVANHLGWAVLLLGMGATAVSFMGSVRFGTRKTVSLVTLGLGAIILAYLLTSCFRYVSAGIVVAMVGYLLLAIGTVRQRLA